MDDYEKKCLVKFVKAIITMDISGDIQSKVDNFHDDFEHIDLDLIILSIKKSDVSCKLKQTLDELIEFYYNNIEENINFFSIKKVKNS